MELVPLNVAISVGLTSVELANIPDKGFKYPLLNLSQNERQIKYLMLYRMYQ